MSETTKKKRLLTGQNKKNALRHRHEKHSHTDTDTLALRHTPTDEQRHSGTGTECRHNFLTGTAQTLLGCVGAR